MNTMREHEILWCNDSLKMLRINDQKNGDVLIPKGILQWGISIFSALTCGIAFLLMVHMSAYCTFPNYREVKQAKEK